MATTPRVPFLPSHSHLRTSHDEGKEGQPRRITKRHKLEKGSPKPGAGDTSLAALVTTRQPGPWCRARVETLTATAGHVPKDTSNGVAEGSKRGLRDVTRRGTQRERGWWQQNLVMCAGRMDRVAGDVMVHERCLAGAGLRRSDDLCVESSG